MMRAAIAWVAAGALIVGISTGFAATKMTPSEIQTTFFTGQPFTASTPANVKFKLTFTPDGKVTREPLGKSGAKGEGTWKLSKDGFCTTWKGSKPNCFTVLADTDKWSVMKGTTVVAVWTKA
jgi:hypothetical protein